MIASRKTFATIDAAAIDMTNASPFGYALCGTPRPGISRPSTSTNPGTSGASAASAWTLRLHRRLVDVHAIDLVRLDDADAIPYRRARISTLEPFALRRRELLRVGHLAIIVAGGSTTPPRRPARRAAPCPTSSTPRRRGGMPTRQSEALEMRPRSRLQASLLANRTSPSHRHSMRSRGFQPHAA
jgi:hypothetical protein